MTGTCEPVCEECGRPAVYCDSVPDHRVEGYSPTECGYRLKPFCWVHGMERKAAATARVEELLVCPGQGIARRYRGRAGGDCLCFDCGRKYYDHRAEPEHPFLTVLCDGSVVKL